MRIKYVACSTLLLVLGCAQVPPNTPGAGIGETYTPVIDMQGVDSYRYSTDLDACRAYARQIDAARAEQQGMLAGMLAGAMVGALVGGNQHYTEQGALAGGFSGMGAAGVKARTKQEVVLANCMAGRGYRVLEGATQPTATNVSSPYVGATAAPVANVEVPVPAPAPVSTSTSGAGRAVAPTRIRVTPAPAKPLPGEVTCQGCQ
jgi:hypothetical protein